jgi:isoleucyl-tRNA synthetase
MRKEADFEVMDQISVGYTGTEKAEGIFEKYATEIAGEVLATSVTKGSVGGYEKEWNINGEKVSLSVSKNQ